MVIVKNEKNLHKKILLRVTISFTGSVALAKPRARVRVYNYVCVS